MHFRLPAVQLSIIISIANISTYAISAIYQHILRRLLPRYRLLLLQHLCLRKCQHLRQQNHQQVCPLHLLLQALLQSLLQMHLPYRLHHLLQAPLRYLLQMLLPHPQHLLPQILLRSLLQMHLAYRLRSLLPFLRQLDHRLCPHRLRIHLQAYPPARLRLEPQPLHQLLMLQRQVYQRSLQLSILNESCLWIKSQHIMMTMITRPCVMFLY
mmetsp:Transcript_16080/g.24236  ORF Transcript_16080/g.24236 Transcript_16080/m.24236 type:complete len:211 (-) Transcript_16080:808-1440(-)